MVLVAFMEALEDLKNETEPVIVLSSSKYIVDGWNTNKKRWEIKDWRLASGKPVKNAEVWKKIVKLAKNLGLTVERLGVKTNDPTLAEARKIAYAECAKRKANEFA